MGGCDSKCCQNFKESREEIVIEVNKSKICTEEENKLDIKIARAEKIEWEDSETRQEEDNRESKISSSVNVKEGDLYWHSCEIFDTLGRIRDSPAEYIEVIENLKNKFTNFKDQAQNEIFLPSEEEITRTKENLSNITRGVDCIMWNEKIFQVAKKYLKQLDKNNNEEIMKEIRSSLSNLDIIDFTLFNYLDTVDTILMIISKSEESLFKILKGNYNYGAVICGFNNENIPVTKIFLANEIK